MAVANFLIFSRARCGSGTLMRLLNVQPGLRCSEEPFNIHSPAYLPSAPIQTIEELDVAIAQVQRSFNGIKHVWESSGWPFDKGSGCNEHLLLQFPKVIFLYRRNSLQRLLSGHVSKETGVYHLQYKDRLRLEQMRFGPVDRRRLERQLAWEREENNRYRKLLRDHGKEFLNLSYEELYVDPPDASSKMRVLQEVLSLVGADPVIRQPALAQAVMLLNPAVSKMNSERTYANIPGIHEIERDFGCNETGWIFR